MLSTQPVEALACEMGMRGRRRYVTLKAAQYRLEIVALSSRTDLSPRFAVLKA